MGLFDTLRCEYPLPDPPAQDAVFQTQDLGGEMGAYTITRAGRLLAHRARWESIPEEEWQARQPNAPRAWLAGSLRAVALGEVDRAYHGDIGIYTRGADGAWYAYTVCFTHGTVEWIHPIIRGAGGA